MFNKYSKQPIFMEITYDTISFFDSDIIKHRLEYSLTSNVVDWVIHDEILEAIGRVGNEIEKLEDEEDIPDEFLDPIMSVVIRDPIILPDTNTIMDLNVISTHLLSNKTNPFTRSPLTLEDLMEYNKKKEVVTKISEFKRRFIKWREEKQKPPSPPPVEPH